MTFSTTYLCHQLFHLKPYPTCGVIDLAVELWAIGVELVVAIHVATTIVRLSLKNGRTLHLGMDALIEHTKIKVWGRHVHDENICYVSSCLDLLI